MSKRLKINIILLATFALIGTLTLIVTNSFMRQLQADERQKIDLWVMGIKQLATTTDTNQDYTYTFEVMRSNSTIPVILVDNNGNVTHSMNIAASKMNTPEKVAKIIERMSKKNEPIVFTLYDDEKNTVYYDDSTTLRQLSIYPYVLLFIILAFVIISYFAISQSWRAEQNGIWVGLAKETAHQLGTPTSSLMACVELLRQESATPQVVEELSKDIKRLERITLRFSKIGSNPDLNTTNLIELVSNSVLYLSGRISSHVKIAQTYDLNGSVMVMANQTLMEWVIENLIKNGVDAMQGKGTITIGISESAKQIFVDISDTGKGIPRANFKTVFNPGYTTKDRGWGLGLTLTKRIVEDYHRGKIFVLKSDINRGTTFRMVLKKPL